MLGRATIRAGGYAASQCFAGACSRAPEQHDDLLMRQAEQGNAQAFERLSWRYDEAILRLLLMLTSSEQEASDLCRATFLAAYQGLARRKTDSLYIWFYRLAAVQWLERAEQEPAISQGLQPLSARERMVFTLKAGQHLALRTVAQIMETSEETIARTFSRAVCKLQLSKRAR
jgi:DNA-directed RNA polymerase specialized sigma24 family protein